MHVCLKGIIFFNLCFNLLTSVNVEAASKTQAPYGVTFWVFEDKLRKYGLDDIHQKDAEFKPLDNSQISYNLTESVIWIKFKIPSQLASELYLELSASTIHFLDFFYPYDSGAYRQISTGFLRNYYTRPILSDRYVFPVENPGWHYIRLESGHFLNTDIHLVNASTLSENSNTRHLFYGLFGGILIVIMIVIIVMAIQAKQYHLFLYVGFIVVSSTVVLTESGIYFSTLWPNKPILNYLFPLYTFGVSYFILTFLKYAFKASELAPSLYRFNFWVLTVAPILPTAFLLWIDRYTLAVIVVQLSSVATAILVLVLTQLCFHRSREFKPYYRLISVGQTLLVFSVAVYIAAQNQLINLGLFRDFTIMMGGVAESVCFTLAIIIYQGSAVKKYYAMLRNQNNMLYTTVQIRTKELERNNNALVSAMQEKDDLLDIIVHDLKSPLHQTKALSKLTLQHITDTKAIAELQKLAEQASDHGLRLIEDLTTISKLERLEHHITFEKVNVAGLVDPLLGNMQLMARQKDIEIDKEIDATVVIESYPNYLLRIVENLLSNAIKFSPPNSRIFFSVDTAGICIQDNGPGFSQEDLERCFRKFQRLSARPTGGESSTGLGLYAVKLLCEKLRIKIELDSELMKGATFKLRFI